MTGGVALTLHLRARDGLAEPLRESAPFVTRKTNESDTEEEKYRRPKSCCAPQSILSVWADANLPLAVFGSDGANASRLSIAFGPAWRDGRSVAAAAGTLNQWPR